MEMFSLKPPILSVLEQGHGRPQRSGGGGGEEDKQNYKATKGRLAGGIQLSLPYYFIFPFHESLCSLSLYLSFFSHSEFTANLSTPSSAAPPSLSLAASPQSQVDQCRLLAQCQFCCGETARTCGWHPICPHIPFPTLFPPLGTSHSLFLLLYLLLNHQLILYLLLCLQLSYVVYTPPFFTMGA